MNETYYRQQMMLVIIRVQDPRSADVRIQLCIVRPRSIVCLLR